tara:strand:- start:36 stop:542 length:507 start_codon:yes stop_codon:yes gene_type:complete
MSCEYCGVYHIEDKQHQMSLTHQTNEFNHFNSMRGTQVDVETWKQREQVIDNYNDVLENESFSCPISTCDFITLNKDAMLEHEANCFGARLNETTEPVNENYVECKDCGKRFYDKGQKLKPKYALKYHQQSCKALLPKKLKVEIKKSLLFVDNIEILKKIQTLINNCK